MLLRNLGLGNGDLDDLTMRSAEKFIGRVYNVADAESCNEARATLLSKCRSPEALPPTSDAARLHIRRAHFQAMIWKLANLTNPTLPLPEKMGWSRLNAWQARTQADISCSCSWKLMVMVMVLHLYSAFSTWIYSNALYNTLLGTLPDYFMAQFLILFNLTSRIHRCLQNRINESDDRPQNRELHALLFTNSVWVL